MQAYSNPDREGDDYSLPDIEVFQPTAHEAAEQIDEDTMLYYLREFPLATMNSRDRDKMLDAIVEREGVTGGWFYWYCFPGCLPDSSAMGPYKTRDEALEAARDDAAD